MTTFIISMFGLIVIAIVLESLKDMHRRSLAHAERMRELEVEELRIQAALPAGTPALVPGTRDTVIRRGPESSR